MVCTLCGEHTPLAGQALCDWCSRLLRSDNGCRAIQAALEQRALGRSRFPQPRKES